MPQPHRERRLSEREWRYYHSLHATLVDRYCRRILNEVAEIATDTEGRPHDQYQRLWTLLKERDRALGLAFNDPRRSDAFRQVATVRLFDLFTEDEMRQFSPETQAAVEQVVSLTRASRAKEEGQDEAAP